MKDSEFISLASKKDVDTIINRAKLVDKFYEVHDNVECLHDFSEALYMSDYILKRRNYEGNLFEFGCYKGGMSCKLSHVAKLIDKKYVIFDSFKGLLTNGQYVLQDNILDTNIVSNFQEGMFSESKTNVVENLKKFGQYDFCTIIEGNIEKTIETLNENISHAFIDVDIIETSLLIIEHIWNKFTTNWIFTHESCIKEYMLSLKNESWWKSKLNIETPIFGNELYKSEFALPNTMCLNFIVKNN